MIAIYSIRISQLPGYTVLLSVVQRSRRYCCTSRPLAPSEHNLQFRRFTNFCYFIWIKKATFSPIRVFWSYWILPWTLQSPKLTFRNCWNCVPPESEKKMFFWNSFMSAEYYIRQIDLARRSFKVESSSSNKLRTTSAWEMLYSGCVYPVCISPGFVLT